MATTFAERSPKLAAVYGDTEQWPPIQRVKKVSDAWFAYCPECDWWMETGPYWSLAKSVGIHIHGKMEFYTYA